MGWSAAAAYVGVALAAASAVVSYSNAQEAEKKAENAANAEASARRAAAEREEELLRQQAADEERAGEEEARRIKENARRVKSAQLAGLGGAGVKIGEGTASDLLMETDKLSEMDVLAALKDSGARANLLRKRGGNLLQTDWYMNPPLRTSSAVATGLSIAGTGLSSYEKYKTGQNRTTQQTNLLDSGGSRSAGASAASGG